MLTKDKMCGVLHTRLAHHCLDTTLNISYEVVTELESMFNRCTGFRVEAAGLVHGPVVWHVIHLQCALVTEQASH